MGGSQAGKGNGMKITGEYILSAPPGVVWQALNDPDVLRRSIPGCETLEKVSDTEFKATVGTRIGPLQAKFNGTVQLTDLDPPNGYTISGSGSGGVAGSAKGGAKIRLETHPQGTRLTYEAEAQVAGKLAQLGGRLIDSTAKMMAGQFFERFQDIVGKPPEPNAAPAEASRPAAGVPWAWIAAGIVAVAVAVMLLLR